MVKYKKKKKKTPFKVWANTKYYQDSSKKSIFPKSINDT